MIYLDYREVPSDLPVLLSAMNVPYEMCRLNIADAQVCGHPIKVTGEYGEVIFFIDERKSAKDFIGSLLSGHLHTQLHALSTTFKHSAVIIEGSISSAIEEMGADRKSVFSAIVGTFLKHSQDGEQGSVSLLMVDSIWDLAQILERTNNKLSEPLIRVEPLSPPQVEDENGQTEDSKPVLRSLLAIRGLGENRARALLKAKGSLLNIALSDPKDLIMEDIGKRTAEKVINHFKKIFS